MPFVEGQRVKHVPTKQFGKIEHVYPVYAGKEPEYRVSLPGGHQIVYGMELERATETFSNTSVIIKSLYHFTDESNIPSIKKKGILSGARLWQWNIDHVPTSNSLSRELDRRGDLQNYVRLCIRPQHRMAYVAEQEGRVSKLAWLRIDPSVITWRSTLFSDRVATDNNAVINDDSSTAFHSPHPDPEVLVEGSIASKWILW